MTDEKRDLPVTPEQMYVEEEVTPAEGPGPSFESDAGPHPEVDQVPSWRLIMTLTVAGALAGLLIVGVFQWAQPQILANRARVVQEAVQDVLGSPDRVETLWVADGRLSREVPVGVDTARAEKVFLGYDGNGNLIGAAITGEKPGYQDVISLIFGYDPLEGEVLGMRVLESKETPGLGDKIFKDSSFVAEFRGVHAPIEGVKGNGAEPHEVDMITGATISSEAVIDIINVRVEALESALTGYIRSAGGGTS